MKVWLKRFFWVKASTVNNNYQDNKCVRPEQIIGEYKGFRIPLLGYFISFANTRIGYIFWEHSLKRILKDASFKKY